MIELSTRTKASYTYVKDWMMLRECVAGCLGSLQTTSHQNVKLKLRLPEGSPAKFVKISGALHITKRASGRDAEAALGDLRFGDKRGKYTLPCRKYRTLTKVSKTSWYNLSLLQIMPHQNNYLRILGRLYYPD